MSEELRVFIMALDEADAQSDEAFRRLLVRGMSLLSLADGDVAHEFGASRLAVTRWKSGMSAPHPASRRPVYSWMKRRANFLMNQAIVRTKGLL